MKMMKVLINISKEDYKTITEDYVSYSDNYSGRAFKAIKDGLVLKDESKLVIDKLDESKKHIKHMEEESMKETGELYPGEFDNFVRDDTLDAVLNRAITSEVKIPIITLKQLLDQIDRYRNSGAGKNKTLSYLEKFIHHKIEEYTK